MSEQQRGKRFPVDDDKAHGIGRGGFVDDGQDDAEGHGFRGAVTDEPAQDDAEGHGFRGNLHEEPASGADDDAAGHAARLKV